MRQADLFGADMGQADLQGADLRQAHLEDADLNHADLTGADLDGARYNDHTSWSVDYDPAAAGAVLEVGD